MAIVSKSILVGYNNCEELAAKWINILDSYRHKDEKITADDLTQEVKDLIENISFLDKDNPPVFIDSDDADTNKDSLRFTFKDGTVVDVSIKDLVDLGAINSVTKRSDNETIIDFTTLSGETKTLDLSAWFANGNFKEVTEIPAYLKVDEISVKTKGSNYSILNTEALTELPLSFFGAKPDLEYIDIGFFAANQITCPLNPFTAADVGKLIAIKDTHHNPNTADGSEFPDSQLGRIVTVTAEILSVDNGLATIDFSCNINAIARAYKYTNNFDALQQAINFCQAYNVPRLVRNGVGIYGLNNKKATLYSNQDGIVIEDVASISIVGDDKNPFKMALEDSLSTFNLYSLKPSNFDFTHQGKIIPPDRYTTSKISIGCGILDTGDANNSVRKISLIDINSDSADTDNLDGFFNCITNNSLGGADEKNKQVWNLENINIRLKNGGLSSFSQGGNTNTLNHKNVDLNSWSNHFKGEQGRELYAQATIDDLNLVGQEWIIDLAYTALDGVVTIDDLAADFSFWDFDIAAYIATGRTISFAREANYALTYNITSVTDAKTLNVTGIPNGSYTDKFKIKVSKAFFGHPLYYHPNQDCLFEDCKSDKETMWFNSSGGVVNPTGNVLKFINSVMTGIANTNTAGDDYTTSVVVENSELTFKSVAHYNNFSAVNSKLHGTFDCNYLTKYDNIDSDVLMYINDTVRLRAHNVEIHQNTLKFKADNAIIDFFDLKAVGAFATLPVIGGADGVINIYNGDFTENDVQFTNADVSGTYNLYRCKQINVFAGIMAGAVLSNLTINPIDYYEDCRNSVATQKLDIESTNKANGILNIPQKEISKLNLNVSQDAPSHLLFWIKRHDVNLLRLHGLASNKFILPEANIYVNQIHLGLHKSDFTGMNKLGWNSIGGNSMYTGEFDLILENGSSVEMTPYLSRAILYKKREDTNLTNLVLKSLQRVDGEIIRFKVDSKQGRLIELFSSVAKKYVGAKPTRKGVENEKVYLNETVFWQYLMDFTLIENQLYTASAALVDESNDVTDVNTHWVIDTGLTDLSILQEKSDGTPYADFSFSIIDDSDTEYIFNKTGATIPFAMEIHADYMRNWWIFEDNTNTYKCYVNNITGKIVFENATAPFTLKASDNFKIINGYQITSAEWKRGNDAEIEPVTTADRTSIFAECRLGYRVYDTDNYNHYFRGNLGWISMGVEPI